MWTIGIFNTGVMTFWYVDLVGACASWGSGPLTGLELLELLGITEYMMEMVLAPTSSFCCLALTNPHCPLALVTTH